MSELPDPQLTPAATSGELEYAAPDLSLPKPQPDALAAPSIPSYWSSLQTLMAFFMATILIVPIILMLF